MEKGRKRERNEERGREKETERKRVRNGDRGRKKESR